MNGPTEPSQKIVFGKFALNLSTRELTKGQVNLRLPDQAIRILEMLLEDPGRIVTRDEIQSRIWGGTPPSDPVHGLNVTMNRLRAALGESAKAPRYIETIPRSGYRFIGNVAIHSTTTPGPLPLTATTPIEPTPRTRGLAVWGAVFLLAVAAMALWRVGFHPPGLQLTPGSVAPIFSLQGTKSYPTLSPDGQQVAFAWTGSPTGVTRKNDIYVKLVSAGEPLRLTTDPADEIAPSWSPDGSSIAFLREEGVRDGNLVWGVYVVAALGGQPRRICAAGPGLSWSPDDQTLVIASPPDPQGHNHIVRFNLKTGDRQDLTAGPDSDSFPVFSPDGRHIAFLRSFTRFARELMLMPESGGPPVRLTWDQRPVYGATWTPDSRALLYACARGAGSSLWRVPVAGGRPELVVTSAGAFQPSMAPKGKRLVYLESYIDSNLYLYEGSRWDHPRRIADSSREENSPRVSPDGERILFVSNRTGSDELWVAPRRGGAALQLTTLNGPAAGSPRWSPDGRRVAFDSRAAGSADIWLIDADGSNLKQLTTDKSHEMLPAWSADGRSIYFCSDRTGQRQIWKMPAEGGVAVQITRNGGLESYEAPDGQYLYYTREHFEPGIWRIPIRGGEEQRVPELAQAGYWRSWDVSRAGIFYFAAPVEGETRFSVRNFRFDTRLTSTLFQTTDPPPRYQSGLAVSPLGDLLVVSKTDHVVNDIVMVEFSR